MNSEAHHKVQAEHLSRNAFLYVRQSTPRQVRENVESTKRQYGLRDQAIALGWATEQIVVIDCDQGQSGSSAVAREGFQKLVTEVSMNRAGIVMGLEVSRLARNSSDWHRLLEICALTRTLLLDDDGLYDPSHFNDRLLLGLKGTMSEAELHVIRSRLQGGILQKARRGELGGRLPTGLVYGPNGRVELDPDRHRTIWVLGSPRYAGAYGFGRTRSQKLPSGKVQRTKKKVPSDQGYACIPNAHAGYISWEECQQNQKVLQDNATQYRCQRQRTPPREGPSLIQGLIICGKCGRRMQVQYH